jgi:hypothetical protein
MRSKGALLLLIYVNTEARGDILMVLPQGISIEDVSVVRPLSINTLPQAATPAGAAASARGPNQQKRRAYAAPAASAVVGAAASALEWSRMALSPSPWSQTDARACRQ